MNFATNEDEAEAGIRAQLAKSYEQQNGHSVNQTPATHKEVKSPPDQSNVEKGGQDSGKKDEEHGKRLDVDRDGPFASYSGDNAKVWKTYMDQAKISDSQLATVLNSDLESLLIFAGLFSAILSAFLIEIRKGLQEDLQATTNGLLRVLIQSQHNSTLVDFNPPPYKPSLGLLWINGLWFSSLIFSLISALGASLAKGWVMQYATASSSRINSQEACLRHDRFIGITRWHLQIIVQSLPIPIHAAFFLFSAGLIILLREDDAAIYIAILTLVVIIASLYIGSTVLPLIASDCPFRTPVTTLISCLISKLIVKSQGASPCLFTKAKALAWLVTNSADGAVIEEATQAIAGLPADPKVQDALYESSVADVFVRGLLDCMMDGGKSPKLRTYLHSILRLVQTGPSTPPNARCVDVLVSLVNRDGLKLSNDMERGIYKVALCIRARVQLLLCDTVPDSVLFDTDVPVLLQSSAEPHIRRLLAEVYLLNRNVTGTGSVVTTGGANPPVSFLDKLRNQNKDTRVKGHEELRNAAKIEASRIVGVSRFGVGKLLMMLTHGSSRVRAQYGKAMREHLVCYPNFRRNVVDNSAAGFLLDLIRCETDLPGHDLLEGFTNDGYARSKLATPEAMAHLTKGMGVESQSARVGIMHAIIRLVKSDDVRATVTTPGVILAILDRVTDTDSEVRQAALKVVAAFLEYVDIRARIATPQLILAILAKIEDEDEGVRQAALKVVAAFMDLDDIRVRVATPELMLGIMAKIADEDEDVQQAALKVVAVFMAHGDIRARVATPELNLAIMAKFKNGSQRVREVTLKVVATFIKHDDIRARVATPELILAIMAKIQNGLERVREATLKVVGTFMNHYDIRARVATPELTFAIMDKIEDEDGDVRETALKVLATFMEHDDIRARVATPELILAIMGKIEDENEDVQQAALKVVVTFMEHDDIRARIATPPLILAILATCGNINPNVQRAGLEVVNIFTKSDDSRLRISTTAVISETLLKLEHELSAVREAAQKILLYVGLAAIIPTAFDRLAQLLVHPDTAIRISILPLLVALAKEDLTAYNTQLLWTSLLKMLRRSVTSAFALQGLSAFADHDSSRYDILAHSDIPKTLLEMIKSDDVYAWVVAAEGLLIFGLF